MRGSQYLGVAVALSLAGASAGEIIGPWDIQSAPIAATEIVGGGGLWDWLNVVNQPITINEAFSGFSIIADGYANGASGTIVEMEFAPGTARNIAGPDLVMFDGRFSFNSYAISTDFDGFATELALPNTAFSDTGVDRDYFYGGNGPFLADIMAAPIDLSDFGVPLGGEVTFVRFRITSSEGDPLGIGSLFVPEPASATIDIKPGSCPNSFNRNSHGVLPVALVGTGGFDVTEVNLSTVVISRADGEGGSASPHEGPPGPHSVVEDVATPFNGELCDCHELTGDGIDDLSMKFKSQEVVAALELNDLPPGALVELCVSGELVDGTEFEACDCIRVVPPGDMDGDGAVSAADLLMLLGAWGPCTVAQECLADLDEDGTVSISDLLVLLAHWS